MSLSDNRLRDYEDRCEDDFYYYQEKDVREAVRELKELFEFRKFCVYCRASPSLCKCDNEIKWAVWNETLLSDIDEIFGEKLI